MRSSAWCGVLLVVGEQWLDGERVRVLMRARNFSLRELGRRIDMDSSQLSRLLKDGDDPKHGVLERIAAALGVAVVELGSRGRPVEVVAEEIALNRREEETPTAPASRPRLVRLEDWGRVPAPSGTLRYRGATVDLPAWIVPGSAVRPVVVTLGDESCEPHLHAGDTLIVDSERSFEDGRYHLLDFQGVEIVRRVRVRHGIVEFADADGLPQKMAASAVRLLGVVVKRYVVEDVP